ncbi:glutamate receptor 2.9 isoform X2 [Hevea brasiliensis]|uniref:glutamate receptor 2.9 isoform X2 n=1 Tax=Hevea brasiliensis TaxID=3981 RepID=UPI0025E2ED83|nr:glutamate receptor 2.9 isoform X2 [Hevea brasiliensis]
MDVDIWLAYKLADLPVISSNSLSKLWVLFLLLITSFFLFPRCGTEPVNQNYKPVRNIFAIIDVNSRIGKEEKTAMEIAVLNFNNGSKDHNISLYFEDHPKNPLHAAQAAQNFIKEKGVEAMLGMERWEEAALVADIGNQAQVPVLSFAAPALTPPLTSTRWPFLARMVYSNSEQMRCIAELTRVYSWRRVVAVYEDNTHGGDSGGLALLSQALQEVGSKIEHRLVLPPFALISDPKEAVREELIKLQEIKSRVFIVLQTSLPWVTHLFREAKNMGLVGEDTIWILTDTVTSFLDSFNTSVIYSMEGALGIKSDYSDSSNAYKSFHAQFRQIFMSEYPEEDNLEPGFHALKAYDSISAIIKAMERMSRNSSSSPKELLNNILSSNFTGLSGQISFSAGELMHSPKLRVVNVVGKKYKEIDFWFPGSGFLKSTEDENGGGAVKLEGPVNWPGDLKRIPKGWAMPSNAKPMVIGVPGRTSFQKFVRVVNASDDVNGYDGFCIELFQEVLKVLDYYLPYRFVAFNGTYDELVDHVYNKTYDAIVGDITILADRFEKVEFTQPYAESGLSMIVPVKSEKSTWIFLKPFNWQMWAITGATLIYTMIIVWILERQPNSEFRGPLVDQIGTTVWFTFSSLFFVHRERISSNFTRVVVVVWLFVVFILTSCYTASLTSMLTIQRMQPDGTNIDRLIRNNLTVGCDGDSFVRDYLQNVLKFNAEKIKKVSSEYDYSKEFQDKQIYAAFLELPYQKVFLSHYCKQYASNTPTYRFGGLGFKGSPMVADFSKAILKLSENEKLVELENKWFPHSPECSNGATDNETDSLSHKNFWGLFVISGATSIVCFLILVIKAYWLNEDQANGSPNKSRIVSIARYIYYGRTVSPSVPAVSSSS